MTIGSPLLEEMSSRRSIRLKNYDYSGSGAYFITTRVYKGQCIFGQIENENMVKNQFGIIVENEWLKTTEIRNNIVLDEFVVMPNHFHGIICILEPIKRATQRVAPTNNTLLSDSLGSILGQFKSKVTKQIRNLENKSFKWQRNYFEHIIRDEKELNKIREYIYYNPMKWAWDNDNPDKILK